MKAASSSPAAISQRSHQPGRGRAAILAEAGNSRFYVSLIHEQAKWPVDLPLMFLAIVSSNDTASHQKSKLILALGLEDDGSRPEREQATTWRSTRGETGSDIGGAAGETRHGRGHAASEASGLSTGPVNLPRSSAASGHASGHHLTFDVCWLQKKRVLSAVVVAAGRYARRGHTVMRCTTG